MNLEIERKWLCNSFPKDLTPIWIYDVYPSYVHISDEVEIRLQKKVNITSNNHVSYKMTTKIGNGLKRIELEMSMNEKEYLHWRESALAPPIHKRFHTYQLTDDIILDMSCVDNDWYYAEIEFWTKEDALQFKLPYDWEEVTDNPFYQMKNYYRRKWQLK